MYLLLLAAVLVSISLPSTAVDFFVTPTQPAELTCPEPCYTLDQYARNVSLFEGQNNISLLFLSGEHILTTDLEINGVNKSVFSGLDPSSSVNDIRAVIDLQSNAGISVSNVLIFGLLNIAIRGKTTYVDFPDPYYDNILTPRGQSLNFTNVSNISMCQVEMVNISLLILTDGVPVQSTVIEKCNYNNCTLNFISKSVNSAIIKIDETNILGNYTPYTHDFGRLEPGLAYSCPTCGGSESLILSLDIQKSTVTGLDVGINIDNVGTDSQLILNKTEFARNRIGVMISGLSMNTFTVRDTRFITNTFYGIQMSSVNVNNFTIDDSRFINNIYGTYLQGSVIHSLIVQNVLYTEGTSGLLAAFTSLHNMVVRNSEFSHNGGAGLYLTNGIIKKVAIVDTMISYNLMSGLVLQTSSIETSHSFLLKNCTFLSNSATGIALINFHGNNVVRDSSFSDTTGTPIFAYQSDLVLSGETSFVDNEAVRGGGLSLIYSTLKFDNNSNIVFRNNTAREFGGAIYVVSFRTVFPEILLRDNNLFPQTCFYTQELGTTSQVSFENNDATLGGKDIYGASDYTCSFSNFKFAESGPTASSITSDPTRVCFCDNDSGAVQLCKTGSVLHNETRFPGETFTLSLVLVGYNFGTVTGTVYANTLGSDYTDLLGQDQHLQTAEYSKCTNLEYKVFSSKLTEIIVLTAQEAITLKSSVVDIQNSQHDILTYNCRLSIPCTTLISTPIYVNVTLEACPLGFKLSTNQSCGCDDTLRQYRVICEIRDHVGFINRELSLWVGVDQNHNDTGYLTNEYCPYNYCRTNMTAVDLTSPDTQCNDNRIGVLCGRCKNSYSLPLGSSRCRECTDNNGLSFLVLFVAAGILLVFLIKLLNLTVANGTISGLIFYANIVWGYNSILLPTPNIDNPLHWILTVPIAWINLDFGFEICFFNGMNEFWKTWLQYVFPIYIWSIAGLIIIISHYSTRATKVFGNNSVAVLATMLLLSYGKILRNTINIFTYANMLDSNGSIAQRVWAFDGTVVYGQAEHGGLIAIGVVILLFLWLPYTLALLLVPFLRSKSNIKPLRWINTLKPFFDAYYGPFNDKVHYQCWTGILLSVRGVLLIAFSITFTISPNANPLLLVATTLALLAYSAMVGLLYKKWYLSLQENLYILNLGILGGGYLFYPEPDPEIYPSITAVSISFAFLQFVCILAFHLVKLCVPKKCFERKEKEIKKKKHTQTVIEFQYSNSARHLRESLLESTVYVQ